MTVSYTGDVANASTFGCFNKILFKWKGSVYKLIYKELFTYIFIYLLINLVYREVLVRRSEEPDPGLWLESRQVFESLRIYCYEQLSSIPMTFVLGFYVSLIVSRWWKQYSLLPWPDSMAMYTAAFIVGKDERVRMMKRNIIRYVLLSYCMAMRTVSFVVKKRFPDLEHLVVAGLLREDELKVILSLEDKVRANKWFLPLAWASDICARALAEKKTRPQTVSPLLGEIVNIRNALTGIINHDWVSVPLVYTQVVTLAIYSYFAAALIGYQWVHPMTDHHADMAQDRGVQLDLFYPFFLTFQFVFFFGWLKVAETLINPFGEDDDDFEINRLIDRHIQVAFLIVDHEYEPELLKDRFWDESIPTELVYTRGAEKYKNLEFEGSAERSLKIKDCDKEYGHVTHSRGQAGVVLSRMPSVVRKEGSYQEKTDIYEPVYFGHYESIRSPTGSKRFTWLMGDADLRRSIKSFNNAVYLSKKIKNKGKRKKIGKFDSIGSLLSMGSYSSLSMSNSGRRSSLYEKMLRKVGSFDGLVHRHDGIRPRSNSHGANKENLLQRQYGIRGRSKSHTTNLDRGLLNIYTVELPKYDQVPKRNFIIKTHLIDTNNASDEDDDMLETITEDPNSPYVTQTSLSQYCDPGNNRPSTSAKVSVMEVFQENEFSLDWNNKLDKENRNKYSTNQYSNIIRTSEGEKEEKKKEDTSECTEEYQIDYASVQFGTVYV
eukprot:GFUD01135879.1.p1 GENE.GFUD01135879.1~~GFUD01135879.1.p1  ORF type:complete len:716 (-),score=153.40 GFUD01135879.1:269-2416(-)